MNFHSYGPNPTTVELDDTTYLIGPNGAGKTATLLALSRLFSVNPALKRMQKFDFHVPYDETETPDERQLWIEAEFTFPELAEDAEQVETVTIPPNFSHMRINEADGIPKVRFRLDAVLGVDGYIEETLSYVLDIDDDGNPVNTSIVPRTDRSNIHVHYLPALRDPASHITLGANALLGRLLRSVNWEEERDEIVELTKKISDSLATNSSVQELSESLEESWSVLHKGSFFADPKISFGASDVESLLRHLSVTFSPGHNESSVDSARLSDGQKSMLYLSLVLSSQAIGRKVLAGDDSFDPELLKPPIFTIVAVEEPENSLSPHFLGRIVTALTEMSSHQDAQALIATHAPSMLSRVRPELIRYLRLSEGRQTRAQEIALPDSSDDAHKFVREAVQAYPEIYFSRLILLGEGDSEVLVLPRLLRAKGIPIDESAITIAPLGGRHVNHFWRLLSSLKIPYITLLDLDIARYQGGWGRIKYVNDQLTAFEPEKVLPDEYIIPSWDDDQLIFEFPDYIELLEERDVFFSEPLDLDFSMMQSYPVPYSVVEEAPEPSTLKAVLGESHKRVEQYEEAQQLLFKTYHKRFKLGSKPAAHLDAMSKLNDKEILNDMPLSLGRLADRIAVKLKDISE